MKIGIIMPSLNDGGVQKVILNLYNGFKKNGVNTTILVGDAQGKLSNDFKKNDVVDYKKTKVIGDYKILFSILDIRETIRKNKFNLVLAAPGFSTVAIIIALLFMKKKPKIVLMVDNTISLLKKGKIKHKISYILYKILYRYSDKIVVAHEVGKKDIINSFHLKENKVIKIYHPLINFENVKKAPIPKHLWLNKNNYVVFTAGRLCPEKDYVTLVRSFSNFKKKVPNAKLIIAGDGEEKNNILKEIEKNNLKDSIDMIGYTNNVIGYMKKSNLYVLSSKQEAFGIVLVEALACGLKIVSTKCDSKAQEEILENGEYGYLCNKEDIQDLTDKMIEAYENLDKKNNGTERAKDFSIEKSVEEYIKLFEEVIR